MSRYGSPPKVVAQLDVTLPEVTYYLYLPVSLAGSQNLTLPIALEPIRPLIEEVAADIGREAWVENYIYATVKKMFCSPSVTANRPGWHADGFGTEDLNFVWYDCLPTEFAVGNFSVTEGDHVRSLQEFEEQAAVAELRTYAPGALLRLDSSVVHRVSDLADQMDEGPEEDEGALDELDESEESGEAEGEEESEEGADSEDEQQEDRKGQLKEAVAAVEAVRQEAQRKRQARINEQAQATDKALRDTLPDWNDTKLGELAEYIRAEGITPDESPEAFVKKGLWILAHKAKAFDALQAEKAKLKPKTELKKVQKPSQAHAPGLTEGTIYFVRDSTTDTFKVAASSGGAAIDLTGAGAADCVVSKIVENAYGGAGTHTISSWAIGAVF